MKKELPTKPTTITFRAPTDLAHDFKVLSAKRDVSQQELLVYAMRQLVLSDKKAVRS
jgi:hypothetical protein